MVEGEAWNANAVSLVAASRAHVYLNIAAFFSVAVARRALLEIDEGLTTAATAPDAGAVVDPLTGRRVDATPFSRVTGVDAGGLATHVRRLPGDDAAAARASRRAPVRRDRRGSGGKPATSAAAAAASVAATPTAVGDDGEVSNAEVVATPLYPVLKKLCDLFVLQHIAGDASFYLRHGYFTSEHVDWIDGHVARLLLDLRSDALALVDAFTLPDVILGTPMARADGDVYRAYMQRTLAVPEATQSAAAAAASGGAVPPARAPYFESLIRPTFEGADLATAAEESSIVAAAADLTDAEWAEFARRHGIAVASTATSAAAAAGGGGRA